MEIFCDDTKIYFDSKQIDEIIRRIKPHGDKFKISITSTPNNLRDKFGQACAIIEYMPLYFPNTNGDFTSLERCGF